MSANEAIVRQYVAGIERDLKTGRATEHTHRPALKALLETLAPDITAVNEPKRASFGAPDYVITRHRPHGDLTIGYIEAKDVGKPLAAVEKDEQMGRYLPNLPNLVLTDYIEFRWYVNGERRMVARQQDHSLSFDAAGAAEVTTLLASFLQHAPEPIRSPRELAGRMARLTHLIRDLALRTLLGTEAAATLGLQTVVATLKGLHQAFTETLIPDLSAAEFADMFAQTLAYGLFAARVNHTGAKPFARKDAAREVPRTNPFLRKLFETLNSTDLDDAPFVGFVDDLAQLLNDADLAAILAQFGKRTRQDDPIVHFYETFLTAYDPKLRELRGVYYTPEPVVGYIVRSVDHLLRSEFGCAEGLATSALPGGDERVILLDPACGTGTFLYTVIEQIRQSFGDNAGMWPAYVRDHLLPRVFGFELLMAPYAMAHLKLGMQLAALDLPAATRARWAYQGDERLNVFLTNTLDEAKLRSDLLMGRYISEEANEAATVKRHKPVMVVLGNPPYSGHSANKGKWITDLLHGKDVIAGSETRRTGDYFAVDGQPLGERNPKWLNDDYVKFIRFAQWRIETTGHGILAFITNNGYLDNPTFRGMRQALLATFDDIYILDLHGNSKKRERSPDGGKDENVFDIQQGVAIGIFVKRQGATSRPKTVSHAHLYGPREGDGGKYAWLADHSAENTPWQTITPQTPFYFFTPQDTTYLAEYEQGWRMTDAMPVNVLGFQTHRDQFAIDFDEKALRRRIEDMRDETISDTEFAEKYELSGGGFDISGARRSIRSDVLWNKHFHRILYRPFDWRCCFYDKAIVDRVRPELQQHMLRPNLSINLTRQTKADYWRNVVVANTPTPALYTEVKDGSNAFPLYLYPDPNKPAMFDDQPASTAPGGRRANLAPGFVADCAARLGLAWVADGKGDRVATFGPEDLFNYMYAVFHSPAYRERYAEYLKTDFPHLPLTDDPALFRELCALGDELVRLHLLERFAPTLPGFPVAGDNVVSEARYTVWGENDQPTDQGNHKGLPLQTGGERVQQSGRVFINATQYFADVPAAVWEFHIGGYQVCQKWLKDRKGRALSYDDLRHYQRIVGALGETIRLMAAIDDAIEAHGGWPLGQKTRATGPAGG